MQTYEEVHKQYDWLLRKIVKDYFISGASWEDLLQEARVGLWEAWKTYTPEKGAFIAFVSVVTRYKVISAIKASTRQKHQPLRNYAPISAIVAAHDNDDNPPIIIARDKLDVAEFVTTRQEILWYLRKAKLTDIEMNALLLWSEGFNYTEIMSILNIKYRAVDNALLRARRKLREQHEPT